jgi:hypothetical protein
MRHFPKWFILCLLYQVSVTFSFSNERDVKHAEDSLRLLFKELADAGVKDSQHVINNRIIKILGDILMLPGSVGYGFEQLSSLGKATSPDSLLRLYTWNTALSPMEYKYYGFVQKVDRESNEISLFFLDHSPSSRKGLEDEIFTPETWYGSLYYQIHQVEHSGKTMYTLIGFDFNNIFTNIKVVDILTFDEGVPLFGAPVFRFSDGIRHRAVFEYSSKVVMFLRYIPDAGMIIYDHLSPSAPRFKGQFRYYGPDFSYDALKFENGWWVYIPEVDWKP